MIHIATVIQFISGKACFKAHSSFALVLLNLPIQIIFQFWVKVYICSNFTPSISLNRRPVWSDKSQKLGFNERNTIIWLLQLGVSNPKNLEHIHAYVIYS